MYFRLRVWISVDNNTLQQLEGKRICRDFVAIREKTADFVVTLHVSTATIPQKWLFAIFLWLFGN